MHLERKFSLQQRVVVERTDRAIWKETGSTLHSRALAGLQLLTAGSLEIPTLPFIQAETLQGPAGLCFRRRRSMRVV